MNRLVKGAVASVLGLASVAGIGMPASADTGFAYSKGNTGQAWFVSYGDHLYVKDLKEDHHSTVAELNLNSGSRIYYYWNHSGVGTTQAYNLDLPENGGVYLRVCEGEYASHTVDFDSCGDYQESNT